MNKVTPAYVIASYRGTNNVMAKLVRWESPCSATSTNLTLVELVLILNNAKRDERSNSEDVLRLFFCSGKSRNPSLRLFIVSADRTMRGIKSPSKIVYKL